MKLTVKQLRTIIKEEVQNVVDPYPMIGTEVVINKDFVASEIVKSGYKTTKGEDDYRYAHSRALDTPIPEGTVVRVIGKVEGKFGSQPYVGFQIVELPEVYDSDQPAASFQVNPRVGRFYAKGLSAWNSVTGASV